MNPTTVRLLVIDDDPVQARAIEAILSVYTEPRFAVADALSLAAGTARLREGEFDAVLLDLTLPDSAGLETYLTMQRQFPNLPIVVLTGTDDENLGMRLVQAGAQDFLVKGQGTGPLLVRTLRYAIERQRAAVERERLLGELRRALAEVHTLSGLLPICAHCKKIRDDAGYWTHVETYVHQHSGARFSHGICPDCMRQVYPAQVGRAPAQHGDVGSHAGSSDAETIRQALARLPTAMTEGLRRATLTADIDRLRALTEEIAVVDPGLAAELSRLTEAFDDESRTALLPATA
ncbi:MAG: hypothetical protein A3K19_00335 [Lentisphaerae bacterium RIFOXYB12_FULL_65_16]|nr:MAG: hypothetical protein A3K18_00395 [Lentisphaerae bacterium RIFOXYA12_64_32]OGV85369.1 MAG: hypothetical protein A3K19_00335 [Lentisphaerae bacterium RIFOXYB12_FULL_65_16]